MEIFLLCMVFFGGAVILYLYSEIHDMDKNMWNQNSALKYKITQLEEEVIQLNREIKSLKEEDTNDGNES